MATKQRLELTWYNKDQALIPSENGKYGYSWADPSDPRYCETHTLVYDERVEGRQTPKGDTFQYSERADLEPQRDNLLVLGESGDLLEALTRVPELAEKYVGKVKLIYIDPPFNTAQTFTSYEDNLEHSIWLTMMRDRLIHLKRLLADDGSIWVHLDDVEVHRMRVLMDEVFGPGRFYGQITWQNGVHVRNDSASFSSNGDTILVYAKSDAVVRKLPPTTEMRSRYSSPDGDPRKWQSITSSAPGAKTHQGMVYAIQHPITGELMYPASDRHWSSSQEVMLRSMEEWARYELRDIDDQEERARRCGISSEDVRTEVPAIMLRGSIEASRKSAEARRTQGSWPVYFFTGPSGRGSLRKKGYIPESYGRVPLTVWTDSGRNDEAKREIQALFPEGSAFATPKPELLVEQILHISSDPGDIILDVFGGSGTTAAVAQKMGRRWVTCELLETTFTAFTRRRLEKVVNDQDAGGVTRTKGERVAADGVDLPDGVSPEDAAKFTAVLNRFIADDPGAKKDPQVKALKVAAKTKRTKDVLNWRGGGGFQIAHLSPACFDYDPALDRVVLTDAATGSALVASIAANLGFRLLDGEASVFDGRRGNALLKVVEGAATIEIVDWLASQVEPGETVVLAATSVMDGVREYLRRSCKGSRVVAVPDDLFRYSEGGDL